MPSWFIPVSWNTDKSEFAPRPFGRSPAFACIGAIFGMGGNLEQSKLHSGNRFFGTIIGGFTFSWMQKFYASHHHKPRQSKKGD